MTVDDIRETRLVDTYSPQTSWLRRCLDRFRSRQTQSWQRVQAVIEKAEAKKIVGEEAEWRACWRPVVQYTYRVNGDTYSGEAEGEIWFYDKQAACEVAKNLEGKNLPIRYKPDAPFRSVYLPSDGGPPQFIPARPDPKSGFVNVSLK